MEDQISEIAGDGLGYVNMEFTQYQAFNEKKVEVKVEFEYDNMRYQRGVEVE